LKVILSAHVHLMVAHRCLQRKWNAGNVKY